MKKLRVSVNGISYDVEVEIIEDDEHRLSPYGATAYHPHHAHTPVATQPHTPVAPPAPTKAKSGESKDSKALTSPIAGTVLEVKVAAGAEVQTNQPLIVIEAMKMETNISSPVSGKVKEIKVKAGDAVLQEQVLVTFE
ncbi:MAG: biotin attachment protein [Candidatus Brocadiae bacterium]|nr:biotin attachment protein [Candidatus Brocadiia bacterium]